MVKPYIDSDLYVVTDCFKMHVLSIYHLPFTTKHLKTFQACSDQFQRFAIVLCFFDNKDSYCTL